MLRPSVILGTCVVLLIGLSIATSPFAANDSIREVLDSEVLGEARPLNIVLPASYSSDQSYPVVYALDGDTRRLTAVAEQMQIAHAELIVVGIENVDRSRDMFPTPIAARQNRGGGGARFLEFITTELIPYIEGEYPTGGYRVIFGQSNSGFFVLYAMLNAPDAFDAYVACSPMVGWDWDMIRNESIELLADRDSYPNVLYMNRGDNDYDQVDDYLPGYVELLAEIAPDDFRWDYVVIDGGGHVPASSYRDAIEFVFEGR